MKPSLKLCGIDRLERLATIGYDYRDWYIHATNDIATLCYRESWSIRRFCDILAITSPRCSIRRNVRVALQYMADGTMPHDCVKSTRQALSKYEQFGRIDGKKTGCFAKNLAGDYSVVTLDSWMARAMVRESAVPDPNSTHLTSRVATFQSATLLVCKLARRWQIAPAHAQACIWGGITRESGRNPGGFPLFAEYDRWLAYDRQFPPSITDDDSLTVAELQSLDEYQ